MRTRAVQYRKPARAAHGGGVCNGGKITPYSIISPENGGGAGGGGE